MLLRWFMNRIQIYVQILLINFEIIDYTYDIRSKCIVVKCDAYKNYVSILNDR